MKSDNILSISFHYIEFLIASMHKSIIEAINQVATLSKPQRKFLMMIIQVFIAVMGHANYRNLSRYCHASEKTISRWFNKGICFLHINMLLISKTPQQHNKIGAIDASFINKSGKHTEGLSMFWSGADGQAKKGLEMSLISIVDVDANTAYALDAKQTIDAEDKSRTALYADHIESVFDEFTKLNITHVVADAFYTKNIFIDRLCDNGFEMVGKLRCDADLKWLYEGEQSGAGRPKIYDGKVKFNETNRFNFHGKIEDDVELYNAIVYCPNMKKTVNVVMLLNTKTSGYALLFSTDLTLDALAIVKYYKARFQIEFVIRDAKQYTGLMDSQTRKSKAINSHLNISLMALNTLKIEDALSKKSFKKSVISIASWKRIKFNENYMESIFSKLEIDRNDEKYNKIFDEFRYYGAIAA